MVNDAGKVVGHVRYRLSPSARVKALQDLMDTGLLNDADALAAQKALAKALKEVDKKGAVLDGPNIEITRMTVEGGATSELGRGMVDHLQRRGGGFDKVDFVVVLKV